MKFVKNSLFLRLFPLVLLFGVGLYLKVLRPQSKQLWTESLKKGEIVEAVYGIGTVMAHRSYKIIPGVTTTITGVYVKEGDLVKKGDQLIAHDNNMVYAAPFSGTVTYCPVRVGENFPPQTPMLNLVDLTDRYLLVSLEQQGALRVRQGQKVTLSFDTIRESNYQGVVQSVYSNENSFLARIDVAKLPFQILPGMTADVAIEIQKKQNVLLVPAAAVELGSQVTVRVGDEPGPKVNIKLGLVDKSFGELVSGDLKEGDQLLINQRDNP